MYYIYNNNSVIISSQSTVPETGTYCISDEIFDLDIYNIIVEAVDASKNLTHYKRMAKPAEQLATNIKALKEKYAYIESALAVLQTTK